VWAARAGNTPSSKAAERQPSRRRLCRRHEWQRPQTCLQDPTSGTLVVAGAGIWQPPLCHAHTRQLTQSVTSVAHTCDLRFAEHVAITTRSTRVPRLPEAARNLIRSAGHTRTAVMAPKTARPAAAGADMPKKVIEMMKEATGATDDDICLMLQICDGDPNKATEALLQSECSGRTACRVRGVCVHGRRRGGGREQACCMRAQPADRACLCACALQVPLRRWRPRRTSAKRWAAGAGGRRTAWAGDGCGGGVRCCGPLGAPAPVCPRSPCHHAAPHPQAEDAKRKEAEQARRSGADVRRAPGFTGGRGRAGRGEGRGGRGALVGHECGALGGAGRPIAAWGTRDLAGSSSSTRARRRRGRGQGTCPGSAACMQSTSQPLPPPRMAAAVAVRAGMGRGRGSGGYGAPATNGDHAADAG
jgi:hypothetical protein